MDEIEKVAHMVSAVAVVSLYAYTSGIGIAPMVLAVVVAVALVGLVARHWAPS